jgi:uncharacterized Tic20 family protein
MVKYNKNLKQLESNLKLLGELLVLINIIGMLLTGITTITSAFFDHQDKYIILFSLSPLLVSVVTSLPIVLVYAIISCKHYYYKKNNEKIIKLQPALNLAFKREFSLV